MKLVSLWRQALHGSEVERARAAEQRLLQAEAGRLRSFYEQLVDSYTTSAPEAVELGTCVKTDRPVRLLPTHLRGHLSIGGPSGSGKTFVLILALMSVLKAGTRRLLCCDPKQEALELCLRMLVTLGKQLPDAEAEDLLSRVVLIDPFGGIGASALPSLQVLAVSPEDDAELVSAEVASILTSGLDLGGFGIRQESILTRCLDALIRAGLPLPCLPDILLEPALLEHLADEGHAPEVLRAAAARLRAESQERLLGVASRVEALLRLKATRLSLSAPSCVDFVALLRDRICLLNLAPPAGSDDIARFWRGLIWNKICRAIRSRPNGAPPVIIAVDEFPQFLTSPQMGDTCQELWRLARSKNSFFWVLQQSTTALAKVTPSLPSTMRVNSHWLISFRSPEGSDWIPLPITGRRPRPPGSLWEPSRPGYLDRHAERQLLAEELTRLPDRHCYLYDARRGQAGILLRTADLKLDATDAEVSALWARATNNDLVRPVAELERCAAELRERLVQLKTRPGVRPTAASSVHRRGARPMEMG